MSPPPAERLAEPIFSSGGFFESHDMCDGVPEMVSFYLLRVKNYNIKCLNFCKNRPPAMKFWMLVLDGFG